MVDDGEGPSSKELTIEGEAQDIEVKEPTPEKESTPVNSKIETRMSRTSSPLTPPEVHSPISRNDEVSTSKKQSSRVIKNHPSNNIIGSLDKGLRLRKGNYSALMTIDHVESSEDLNLLVQELGEHSDKESMGVVEEDKSTASLQENYNSLLEKSGKYARVAMAAVKKMKKAEEDYKKVKCEIETLNGELTEAHTKVKFLELEVVQANAKIERVSTKKLDEVLSQQKWFSDRFELGYTRESIVINIVSFRPEWLEFFVSVCKPVPEYPTFHLESDFGPFRAFRSFWKISAEM